MRTPAQSNPRIAIACGGTGGHFFPGVAVAQCLEGKGCDVILFVSSKAVDQEALKSVPTLRAVSLPASGLTRSRFAGFAFGFVKSFAVARAALRQNPCGAILAMGGFTSAPPVLAGKRLGAKIFLHESNTIPGRANRWLSRLADQCFVGFPECAALLRPDSVVVTGTPVRRQFRPGNTAAARRALNLDPEGPVLLVMGGSQGASALNTLAPGAAAHLKRSHPAVQVLHLSGSSQASKVSNAYRDAGVHARVLAFLDTMDLAMQASSAAIARAGASTLAELAATQLPAVLIPFPAAAENHQFYNASAFSNSGAACLLTQTEATPERLAACLGPLLADSEARRCTALALEAWHQPEAAERISQAILRFVAGRQERSICVEPSRNDRGAQHCAIA